ncbi:MAG: hypothetical protein GY851_02660 [bacterium]|nr:hypothetical protein [bacterium]
MPSRSLVRRTVLVAAAVVVCAAILWPCAADAQDPGVKSYYAVMTAGEGSCSETDEPGPPKDGRANFRGSVVLAAGACAALTRKRS